MVQLEVYVEGSFKYPANIYLFKLNNKHASPNLGGGRGEFYRLVGFLLITQKR